MACVYLKMIIVIVELPSMMEHMIGVGDGIDALFS